MQYYKIDILCYMYFDAQRHSSTSFLKRPHFLNASKSSLSHFYLDELWSSHFNVSIMPNQHKNITVKQLWYCYIFNHSSFVFTFGRLALLISDYNWTRTRPALTSPWPVLWSLPSHLTPRYLVLTWLSFSIVLGYQRRKIAFSFCLLPT